MSAASITVLTRRYFERSVIAARRHMDRRWSRPVDFALSRSANAISNGRAELALERRIPMSPARALAVLGPSFWMPCQRLIRGCARGSC